MTADADDARLMRYAKAIARVDVDFIMLGYPLPDLDHPHWKIWKLVAAAVVEIADEEIKEKE